ncbi:MAG: hypothetical protein ACSLE1_15850 [Sphingobium sp.]
MSDDRTITARLIAIETLLKMIIDRLPPSPSPVLAGQDSTWIKKCLVDEGKPTLLTLDLDGRTRPVEEK